MKTNNDYLRLAQWAYKKWTDQPAIMKNRELRDKYIDILALNLDLHFQDALEMAKDQDFKLPKENK